MISDFDPNKEFLFDLPKIEDERGNLSFLEIDAHVPFSISRVYWIYDVPAGQERGSHAFKTQEEIIIALSGSFDVVLDDARESKTYHLNRAYKALYIPAMTWRSLANFSTNSVCLVLNSGRFTENEYIRDYAFFEEEKSKAAATRIIQHNDTPLRQKESQYHTIFDCSLFEFNAINNRAGNITPVESLKNIPFQVKRVFYTYDIPGEAERGMHAHKYCHEVLIATTGSFDVELNDGTNKRIVRLNSPKRGLHIPPGVWAKEKEYSSGASCLVLASEKYDQDGYINSYEEFKKYRDED